MENFTRNWLACTQTLPYFPFRSFQKHRRARKAKKKNKHDSDRSIFFLPHYYPLGTPLRWQSINPPRLLFFITRSTDFEEKIEGLGTGYRLADWLIYQGNENLVQVLQEACFCHFMHAFLHCFTCMIMYDQSIVGRTSFSIIKLFRTDSFTHYYWFWF